MNNFSLLSSRAVWTQIFQQAYNLLGPMMSVFPNNVWLTLAVNIIGTVLTIYFHVNPSQQYNTAAIKKPNTLNGPTPSK